jgi:hypothetical protein
MTDEKVDVLQAKVASWYKRFRLARQMHIANTIDPVLAEQTDSAKLLAQIEVNPFPFWGGKEPSWEGIREMIREAENRTTGYEGAFLRNSRRSNEHAGVGFSTAAGGGMKDQCTTGCAPPSEYMILGQRVASLEAENLVLKRFAAELEHRVRQIELGLPVGHT